MSEMSADHLVKIYIKMRNKKSALTKEIDGISEQMEEVAQALLEICKETGAQSLRTSHGTVSKKVATRYWSSDWESMWNFVREHNAYELVEKRVSSTAMSKFLEANPDLLPIGLNIDSKYTVSVRKS